MKGQVVRVETGQVGSSLERFGNFVVVAHDPLNDGTQRQTTYLHLDSTSVIVGQSLETGDTLGTVGDSGVGIQTVHLHFEYQEGVSNGLQSRLNTRNPFTILPFTQRIPTLNAQKISNTNLRITISQFRDTVDLVRFEFSPDVGPQKIIDFHSREGLDNTNEDNNPFDNVTITPSEVISNDSVYNLQFDWQGNWTNTSQLQITVTDALGGARTVSRAL